jgi:hypothetical protein
MRSKKGADKVEQEIKLFNSLSSFSRRRCHTHDDEMRKESFINKHAALRRESQELAKRGRSSVKKKAGKERKQEKWSHLFDSQL